MKILYSAYTSFFVSCTNTVHSCFIVFIDWLIYWLFIDYFIGYISYFQLRWPLSASRLSVPLRHQNTYLKGRVTQSLRKYCAYCTDKNLSYVKICGKSKNIFVFEIYTDVPQMNHISTNKSHKEPINQHRTWTAHDVVQFTSDLCSNYVI